MLNGYLLKLIKMKKALTLLLLAISMLTKAQSKLYYFTSNNSSLVGVKDEKGKIIIPAVHYNFSEIKNKEQVEGEIIYLIPEKKSGAEPHGFGLAYDRKGKVLFTPYAFDNGPDGINEGLMRYVKNGKIGFVNRVGQVIIPAQYDFVSYFDYGIARYCNGCVWDNSTDIEHPELKGGTWGFIDKQGKDIQVSIEKTTEKDQVSDSAGYLPYQFYYTAFEQKIVDSFYNIPLINKAFLVNHYGLMEEKEKALYYEIVERPSSSFPYYHVKAFTFTNDRGYYGESQLNFYVSKDGKKYFNLGYYNGSLAPLGKWLKEYVQEAKTYLKNHPDVMYKF